MPSAYATVPPAGQCSARRAERAGSGAAGAAGLTDVPALCEEDAEEEEEQRDTRADPPVEDVGRRLVEERLVLLPAGLVTAGRATQGMPLWLLSQRTLWSLLVCALTVPNGDVGSLSAFIVTGGLRRGVLWR